MDPIILQLPSGDLGDNAISCCSEALMVHTFMKLFSGCELHYN